MTISVWWRYIIERLRTWTYLSLKWTPSSRFVVAGANGLPDLDFTSPLYPYCEVEVCNFSRESSPGASPVTIRHQARGPTKPRASTTMTCQTRVSSYYTYSWPSRTSAHTEFLSRSHHRWNPRWGRDKASPSPSSRRTERPGLFTCVTIHNEQIAASSLSPVVAQDNRILSFHGTTRSSRPLSPASL